MMMMILASIAPSHKYKLLNTMQMKWNLAIFWLLLNSSLSITEPTHAKLLWWGWGVAEEEELLSTEPEPEPWKSEAPISDLMSASSVIVSISVSMVGV